MSKWVKDIFLIIGTLVVSLLLFALMFGDTGKLFIWDSIEPLFQANWKVSTFDDGVLISNKLTETFDNVVEIHN